MDRTAMRKLAPSASIPLALLAPEASAHGENPLAGELLGAADLPLAVLLLSAAALYALGVTRLWRKAGVGRGIDRTRAGWFACGWLVLVVALLSPLDRWGNRLLWVHMLQHELLMVVAAPLLALGRPLEAWTWALPVMGRRACGGIARNPRWRALWLLFTAPLGAWIIQSGVIWLWHAPALFQAALSSDAIHTLQHTSFLAGALVFWWAIFGAAGHRPKLGISALMLFSTMLHTGALGALLTFSASAWYPLYATAGPASALAPIEDQQIAGLIMWVPGGLAYMVAALAIAARALAPAKPENSASIHAI